MGNLLSFERSDVPLTASAFGDSSAPPILFLHATGQSRWVWEAAARLVGEQGFRGIAPDLRGHGDSGWAADGDYSLKAFANDIIGIIDQLDVPVTIVGNSLGGWTGLAAAAQRADRVRLVASFDAAPTVVSEDKRFYDFLDVASRGFDSVEQAAEELEVSFDRPIRNIERFRARFRERDGRLFFRWDPALARHRRVQVAEDQTWLLTVLQGFTRPTVLMLAEHNSSVTREAVRDLLAAVPQVIVERWKGTRHGITTRDSLRIATRTLSHLERLDGRVAAPPAPEPA